MWRNTIVLTFIFLVFLAVFYNSIGLLWVLTVFCLSLCSFVMFSRENTSLQELEIQWNSCGAVLEPLGLGCIVIDQKKNETTANAVAKDILGLSFEPGQDVSCLTNHPELGPVLLSMLEENEVISQEVELGAGRLFQVSGRVLGCGRDKRAEALLIIKPVSEREEGGLALCERERLNTVGKLAEGVAHEMRQPLTTIKGFAQLTKQEAGSNNKLKGYSSVIMQEMDRLNEIISEFIELAKPSDIVTRKTQLNKIINKELQFFENDCLMKDINIEIETYGLVSEVEVDEAKVRRVLSNIISNAVDAMEDGGNLTIATREESNYVVLSVQDTGEGIPEEYVKMVNSPFFTTRPHGTGLGLSICRRIMEQHQGDIEIFSCEGKGTRVELKFKKQLPWVQDYLLIKDLEGMSV